MSTQDNAGVDPGPGWRLLEAHERIQAGDELCDYACKGLWLHVQESIGDPVHQWDYLTFRRRLDALPQPSPAPAHGLSAQIRALPCDGAEQYGDSDLESAMHTGFLQGHQRALEAAAELTAATEVRIARLEAALIRLRNCDWVITPRDRMDAVRDIAREALAE